MRTAAVVFSILFIPLLAGFICFTINLFVFQKKSVLRGLEGFIFTLTVIILHRYRLYGYMHIPKFLCSHDFVYYFLTVLLGIILILLMEVLYTFASNYHLKQKQSRAFLKMRTSYSKPDFQSIQNSHTFNAGEKNVPVYVYDGKRPSGKKSFTLLESRSITVKSTEGDYILLKLADDTFTPVYAKDTEFLVNMNSQPEGNCTMAVWKQNEGIGFYRVSMQHGFTELTSVLMEENNTIAKNYTILGVVEQVIQFQSGKNGPQVSCNTTEENDNQIMEKVFGGIEDTQIPMQDELNAGSSNPEDLFEATRMEMENLSENVDNETAYEQRTEENVEETPKQIRGVPPSNGIQCLRYEKSDRYYKLRFNGYEIDSSLKPSDEFKYIQITDDNLSPNLTRGDLIAIHLQNTVDENAVALIYIENKDVHFVHAVYKDGKIYCYALTDNHLECIIHPENQRSLYLLGVAVKLKKNSVPVQ